MSTPTTTTGAIRDRIIAVIESLVPTVGPSAAPDNRFKRYRNEGDGDFVKWAVASPDAAFRRFQVRWDGVDEPPEVSNTDIERRKVTFLIHVAYPQNSRAGSKNALDRDDMITQDFHQIDFAIGMCGRANFTAPTYPDANWYQGGKPAVSRSDGGLDILTITESYMFNRSTP